MGEFIHHTSCDACGSSDGNAVYADGGTHCFVCHKTTRGGAADGTPRKGTQVSGKPLIRDGEFAPLTKRKLTDETCQKWSYRVGRYAEKPVQIADYRDAQGNVVAQKVRFPDKSFTVTGDMKQAQLFGQHLWRDKGRRIIVTEGEIDAMTVSQIQGHKWPVVSIPNGAQCAAKALAKQIEWLAQFQEIVLCFDMDEPGRLAARECAELFEPGQCKIVELPLKDPNDMLVAGRVEELTNALWGAKEHRPDGIVTIRDIKEAALRDPEQGFPWWMPTLTKQTFGRREGECYAFGAGTGIGKTDWITQQIEYDLNTLGQPVGAIFLEQQPEETAKRVAGKMCGKRFHVPDGSWSKDDLIAALDKLEGHDRFYMYNHFGVADWDVIKAKIRFLHKAHGVKLFYLDHLTALATGQGDSEKEELERIMAEIGGMVKSMKIIMHFVSHLATPEGKPHEEGGRVMIRHFKGSRAIGFWSHFMFGFERNQQAEDLTERQTTKLRILKDRLTGQSTGNVIELGYDVEAGRLHEKDGAQWAFSDATTEATNGNADPRGDF